ncbi:MAG: ABC transporter permease [Methanobrevibacter sp.]|uniref:ABC transporter permease n=1 Tax=Methanobrevibacter sp. TaxID=66852 RepID=UPI0026DF3394|nr:ABC transporter permease [Methanobrevibacter sp.]MDO5848119.1 ABC transporter permease [Methanobrevibacter sp.]
MLDFIEMEFLKLRRSKFFIILILGILTPSFLMFLGLMMGAMGPISMKFFLDQIVSVGIVLFNVIIYALLAAYLIVMEYNDHTLKSILTTPISKNKFILGKWVMVLILVFALTLITFIVSVVLGYAGGATDIDFNMLFNYFIQFVGANILLAVVITPFLFISLIFKNIVPGVIGGVIVAISNFIVYSTDYAPLSPFCSPFLIVCNELAPYGYGVEVPLLIIALTGIFGLLLSMIYFNKSDVAL